ncbi:MAG: hypothetical protein ACI3Y4_03870 [Candidatus Cryptobacteroides sp.]
MFHQKLTLLFAIALVSVTASAQTSDALPFVRTGHSAAREAMAGAGSISGASAAWASFDNAALAVFGDKTLDAAFSYNSWAPSSGNMFAGGLTYRLGSNFGITAGAYYGLGKEYDIYSNEGVKKGTFTPTQMQFNLGAGLRILPWLSVGVNVHAAMETLAESANYKAFSGDLFLMGKMEQFSFTAGVVSLGTPVKSSTGATYNLPSSVKLGGGYEDSLGALACSVYADLDYFFLSSGIGASVGADLTWDELASLRAGYHFASRNAPVPSYFSAGLGGHLLGFSLDAAVLLGGQLTGTVLVTLGYSF